MPYSVPAQWAHGNTVASTEMQKYSDSLNYLAGVLGSVVYNHAFPYSLYADTQEFWVAHARRYLVFASSGRIVDPTGVEDDISLSPGDGTYGSYDMDSITWMTYGKVYQVIGCSVCFEDGTGT